MRYGTGRGTAVKKYTMALPCELSPDEAILRCISSQAVLAMCKAPVAGWKIGSGDAVLEFVHAPNPGTPVTRLVSLGDTCTDNGDVPEIGEEIVLNGVEFLVAEVSEYLANGTADDGAGMYDFYEVTIQTV